jgi:N-acetylmuramoyl-L-alanine amidase
MKNGSILMRKKYFNVLFLAVVYLAILFSSPKSIHVMKELIHGIGSQNKGQMVIVIDPGHGGRDPGKVGVNDALEKDINLCISSKLKSLLEQNDIKVVMTREDDSGLYTEADSNKKSADLRKRVEIIQENDADLAVSIHQNSFPEEYVKGAQVFYHMKSDEGRILSEMIQEQLKITLMDGNHRKAKSNDNYYMLKKTNCPLVIIECGYLSNYNEAALLLDERYQEKLAWGIHLGIMRYINEQKEHTD